MDKTLVLGCMGGAQANPKLLPRKPELTSLVVSPTAGHSTEKSAESSTRT